MISLISYILAVVIFIVIVIVIVIIVIVIIIIIIFIWPARSWLKTWAERGGRCTARCWKMKRGCAEIKMWGKCGVQNHKIGVWAWCLLILFVVLKTAKFGVKIVVLGVEDVKNKPTSPTYGKSMLRRNQIAATIIYCNVLLLQLQYFNSLQQGTPPCGNTAATLSLWPNMTKFYPYPGDAVKPWNFIQVKLPGFRKLEIGNKTCDPTGPTALPFYHFCWLNGTELSSESALSEAESSTDESAGNFPFGLGF